jgi:phage terminase large subunit
VIPDQYFYHSHGAARLLFACRDGEILVEGPAGTGKSRALLEKVHACAQSYPGMRALLVRKTRRSMTESVLVTLERNVFLTAGMSARGASRATRQAYVYGNGSSQPHHVHRI